MGTPQDISGKSRHRLAAMLLALWLCLLPGAVHAFAPVQPRVCLTPVKAGDVPRVVLDSPARFDCRKQQTELGKGDYWARLSGFSVAADEGDSIVLRMASVWQDAATIHVRYADGVMHSQAFTSATASRYLTIGAFFEIPFPPRDIAVTDILIRTKGSANVRGVVLGAEIMSAKQSAKKIARLTALYAGFAGLSLALIFYNLSLWAALRYRFQLLYCGMATAMCLYTFSASGSLMLAFPSVDNLDRLRINYALLGITGAMATVFIRAFFEPRVITRTMDVTTNFAIGFILLTSAAFTLFTPWQMLWLDRLYFASFLTVLLLIPPLLWRAYKEKSQYTGLFALAWSAPLVTSLLRSLHGIGLIPYSFWLDNSSVLAMGAEALLSSLVISARIKILSRERDAARAEEVAARKLAHSDPLTGLLNRRALLETALERGGTVALILIDLDHFKSVNDTHGHQAGDDVLRAVGGTLSGWARDNHLVARIGGEEFAILIPTRNLPRGAVDRLLDAIRETPQPTSHPVSASIGVAHGPLRNDEDWKHLYRQADLALYRAKSDGRDRACFTTLLSQVA